MGQPRIAAAAAAADGRGRDPPGQSLATGAAQRRDRTPAGADRKPQGQSRRHPCATGGARSSWTRPTSRRRTRWRRSSSGSAGRRTTPRRSACSTALAARSGNLAAKLEFARVAARRGDAAALARALDALAQHAPSWPADAQERLKTVRQAARDNPAAAATSVIFLKNVLIREPEYRAALAAVSTPRAEVGEPMVRLISLPNPDPQPAAADDQLAFLPDASPAVAVPAAAWAGALWLTGEGAPALVAASAARAARRHRRDGGVSRERGLRRRRTGRGRGRGPELRLPHRPRIRRCRRLADLQAERQRERFTAVTADARLPADVTSVPLHAVWPADIDTDGDLDLVVATPRRCRAGVLRNNGDGTFAAQSPFGTRVARARLRLGRSRRRRRARRGAARRSGRPPRLPQPARRRRSASEPCLVSFPRVAALAVAERQRRRHRRRPRRRGPTAPSRGSRLS